MVLNTKKVNSVEAMLKYIKFKAKSSWTVFVSWKKYITKSLLSNYRVIT